MKDYSSILVKSSSTNRPHFVERTGDAKYRCDKECLMFKSTNGMCSHCLLLAVLNGEVDTCRFVRNYSRTKDPINYMQLGQYGLPVGGKKPSSKRKASSKKTTSKIRRLIADSDSSVHSKRSNPSVTSADSLLGVSQSSTPLYSVGISAPYASFRDTIQLSPLGIQSPSSPPHPIPPPDLYTSQTAPYSHHPPSAPPISQSAYPHLSLGLQTPQSTPYTIQLPSMSSLPCSLQTPHLGPPPLIHHSPAEKSVGQTFKVVFSNPRISRCQGC